MGFLSRLFGFDTYDAAQRVLPYPYEPFVGVADPGVPLSTLAQHDVEAFWKSQPNVRKVVSFIARNVASIPLHVYERISDTDRRRVTDHPLARVLSNPRPGVGAYRFWNDTLSDGLLYDRWATLKVAREDGGLDLVQIPSRSLRLRVDGLRRVTEVVYWVADDSTPGGRWVDVPLEEVVFDHGYAPSTAGLSPIETLRDVLDETAEAVRYRRQVWANGARVPAWIERPAGAEWSAEAKGRFSEQFRAAYTGNGENAGGVPLLEDGMRLNEMNAFASKDAMDLEGRRLTSAEVAAAFHVAPELVGAQQGTFSNIDAFRQMLYRDSLGPYITAWEQALNTMLTPDLTDGRNLYIEANIEAKLRGSFQEQAQVLSTSTGAPWMSRAEARARMNLPHIDGSDELVTPLNVLVGGQASPRDGQTDGGGGSALLSGDDIKRRVDAAAALIRSGFDPAGALEAVGLDPIKHLGLLPITVQKPLEPADQDVDESLVDEITEPSKARKSGPTISRASTSGPLHVKAAGREQDEKVAAEVLRRFFKRQRAAVLSALGSKAGEDWWDAARWDKELSDDLFTLAATVTGEIGAETAEALGFDADAYDQARTLKFLRAVAESRAGAINATTLKQVRTALAEDVSEDAGRATPTGVFDLAETSRTDTAAVTLATTLATFAVTEFGRQSGRPGVTKTWVNTSGNPRPSHAAMDGETVPIEELFSNGMDWPGDPGGGVDEVAGCSCVVDITIP